MGSGDRTVERIDGVDPQQLARMQGLASRCWSWSSRWHPGELTWFWWEHGGPGPDSRVATWQSAGDTVAWARHDAAGRLDLQVDPERLDVLDDVLRWFGDFAAPTPTVTVCDAETALLDALVSRGWSITPVGSSFAHLRMNLAELPLAPELPAGWSLRMVEDEQDVEDRAGLHRHVFGAGAHSAEPSGETYRRVRTDPHYRSGLDWMAVTDEAVPAAFSLSWINAGSAVAVLEPVGTAPEHRRRGLARAVVVASLEAAARLGADHARVCARVGVPGDEAAVGTYESLGFRRYARNVRLVRPRPPTGGGTGR